MLDNVRKESNNPVIEIASLLLTLFLYTNIRYLTSGTVHPPHSTITFSHIFANCLLSLDVLLVKLPVPNHEKVNRIH